MNCYSNVIGQTPDLADDREAGVVKNDKARAEIGQCLRKLAVQIEFPWIDERQAIAVVKGPEVVHKVHLGVNRHYIQNHTKIAKEQSVRVSKS